MTTKADMAKRLRKLSDEMLNVAAELDYFGGFAEFAKHGKELAGAGSIVQEWATEMLVSGEEQKANEQKVKE